MSTYPTPQPEAERDLFRHGLRPLYLAPSIEGYKSIGESAITGLVRCLAVSECSSPPEESLSAVREFEELRPKSLLWFRWITGHQVSFAAWQLLGLLADRHDEQSRLAAARLVEAYSLMLMYCGSCSQPEYQQLIRPTLMRYHEAFSGTWARDYSEVRRFLRHSAMSRSDDLLRHVIRQNHLVHELVGQRLVESGKSLLREATERHGQSLARLEDDDAMALYDCAFLVVRSPITLEILVHQLLVRLQAIHADVECPSWTEADINTSVRKDHRWRDVRISLEGIGELIAALNSRLEHFRQTLQNPNSKMKVDTT